MNAERAVGLGPGNDSSCRNVLSIYVLMVFGTRSCLGAKIKESFGAAYGEAVYVYRGFFWHDQAHGKSVLTTKRPWLNYRTSSKLLLIEVKPFNTTSNSIFNQEPEFSFIKTSLRNPFKPDLGLQHEKFEKAK